eukprot:GILK01009129.1.p1 GENE.GILK01009129.1~~GILK01009129.1.p1  ORF type:complete len:184 (+),score=22.35 GILK01009129.1:71-622(+)
MLPLERASEERVSLRSGVPVSEKFNIVAIRVLHTRAYVIFCACMAVFSMTLLTIMALNFNDRPYLDSPGFIVSEVLLTFIITIEVVLEVLARGKTYYRSCWRIFDVLVMVVSISAQLLYLFHIRGSEVDDMFSFVALLLRYMVQPFRLAILLRSLGASAERQRTLSEDKIQWVSEKHPGWDDM